MPIFVLAVGSSPAWADTIRIAGGTTRVVFAEQQLSDLGILIRPLASTGAEVQVSDSSDFRFDAPGGAFEDWASGTLLHDTGIQITTPAGSYEANQLRIAAGDKPLELVLRADDGKILFRVESLHTGYDPNSGILHAVSGDLLLSGRLAEDSGYPEHQGLFAGELFMVLETEAAAEAGGSGGGGQCSGTFGPSVDLELTAMPQLSQVAREAGVRVAMAPSADLMNVGQFDVRWYWAIAPSGFNGTNIGPHPFLIMHFYREHDGVFEQIGRSDVKHAWNTVNSGCPCSPGQVMYTGCGDRYGIGNNANQFYFGPRDELTAHLGAFQSLGSHFDGIPNDDNTRNHGWIAADHDRFEHRLVVQEPDLSLPDAVYHIEAWYVVALDSNAFNNIGYRSVNPQLSGSTWTFPFVDAGSASGLAIDAWVDPSSPAPGSMNRRIVTGEGNLQVAVRTWTNAPGEYHYEYALMNMDYDRQVESFAVPFAPGTTITGIEFGDVDDVATNDWTAALANGHVTWSAPGGGADTNACDWGTLFNFRFDADAAPATNAITMSIHEEGAGDLLLAQSLAPEPAPRLSVSLIDFSANSSRISSRWTSLSGAVYQLQSTGVLDPLPGWTNLGGAVTSDGAVIEFQLPGNTASQQFHRVEMDGTSFP